MKILLQHLYDGDFNPSEQPETKWTTFPSAWWAPPWPLQWLLKKRQRPDKQRFILLIAQLRNLSRPANPT